MLIFHISQPNHKATCEIYILVSLLPLYINCSTGVGHDMWGNDLLVGGLHSPGTPLEPSAKP